MYVGNPYLQYPAGWSGNTYSMLFDGVNESLSTGINPTFAPTSSMSGSVWVKVVDTTSSVQAVVARDSASGSNRDWLLFYRGTASDRKMHIVIWNTSGAANELISSTAGYFEDGAWHHVAWTYDGTAGTNGLKLYIDGSLDVQKTTSSTGIRKTTGTDSDIAIGDNSQQAGGWTFGGNIDEVALWDGTVLSSTDISNIYNSGTPDDLTSFAPDNWYRMGDHTSDSYNGTDWTIVNAVSTGTDDMTSLNMESGDRVSDVP